MPNLAVTYSQPTGHSLVTLSGTILANDQFTVQPVAGDQIIFATGGGLSVSSQLAITGDTGSYDVWHVRQDGTTEKIVYYIGSIVTNVTFSAGANYTTATLAQGYDTYVFQNWDTLPDAGSQLTTLTADGYFDSAGNYYSDVEHVHAVWFTDLDGVCTRFTVDSTLIGSDSGAPDFTTPLEVVAGSQTQSSMQVRFSANPEGSYRIVAQLASDPFPSAARVLAGESHDGGTPLSATGLTAYTANIVTTVLLSGLPSGSNIAFYIAVVDSGGLQRLGVRAVGTTTSDSAAPVWTAPPNVTYSDAEVVNLDLRQYVTGAVSFTITGLASGTGLSLDPVTGVLSGTVNDSDASGSAGTTVTRTVTVTAINGSGSTPVSFDIGFYKRLLPSLTSAIPDQSWSNLVPVPLNLANYFSGASSYEVQIDEGAGWVDAVSPLSDQGITANTTTGQFSGTPNATGVAESPNTMRARAVNSDGQSAWDEFTATISDASFPAIVGPIPSVSITEGNVVFENWVSYFFNAASYYISGLPTNTGLVFNTATCVLSGTANQFDVAGSPLNLVVTATNANGSVSSPVVINVTGLARPSISRAFTDLSQDFGTDISITPANNFSDFSSITLSGLPVGSGLTYDGTDLTGSLNLTDKNNTPLVLTFTATNQYGSVSDTFLINVTGSVLVDGTVTTPAIRTVVIDTRRKLPPKVFTLDSKDKLDFAFDLSAWLGTDTIDSVVITENEALISSGVKGSTSFSVFVSGPLELYGEAEKITAHVRTVGGRGIDVSMFVVFVDY